MLTFKLEKSDSSISISYSDSSPGNQTEANLLYLSEEELLAEEWNDLPVMAFYGEVVAVHNLEAQLNSQVDYFSVIEFKIMEDLRTDKKQGEIISVRVPGHITEGGGTNTIMDTAVFLHVGKEAVIMPIQYNETSLYESDGQVLFLKEVSAGFEFLKATV